MNPATITLSVIHGSLAGQEFVFDKYTHCVIGRAEDCDIGLQKDYNPEAISRHHCLLEINPPIVRVRDLGSCNGTYLNGQNIGQPASDPFGEGIETNDLPYYDLEDGDTLQVGNTVFRVGVDVGSEEIAPIYVPMYFT